MSPILRLAIHGGSELSDEVANGISLALVQTDKGRELLEMTDLELLPVDPGLAVANNEQLQRPSTKPIERNTFMDGFRNGVRVNRLVLRARPKDCAKYLVKDILLALGLLRG